MSAIQFPQEMLDAHKTNPLSWFCEVQPPSFSKCENCGDLNNLYMFFAESGPYQSTFTSKKVWHYVDDQGWFLGEFIAYACPVCSASRQLIQMKANSGLEPIDFETMTFSTFKSVQGKTVALDTAKHAVESKQGIYTFYGLNGRGKTHLLKAIVNECIVQGVPAIYVSLPELLAYIREGFSKDDKSAAEERLYRYRIAKALCVDEPDKINKTDWAYETIFRVINHRYDGRRSLLTVVGSETEPSKLDDTYLYSRLRSGIIVEVDGDDMRMIEGYYAQKELLES